MTALSLLVEDLNPNGTPILNRTDQMREGFSEWKVGDRLVDLPPPP